MATPRLYYYPDPDGSLETIDFGEGLSDLQELPSADVADAYNGAGVGYRSLLASTLRLRIVLERFGSVGTSSLERKLMSLQAHLAKGGLVGFSRDHAKTWAGKAQRPTRGDTVIYTNGNGFTAWSSSGNIVQNDEVVLETPHPDAYREVALVGAVIMWLASHVR